MASGLTTEEKEWIEAHLEDASAKFAEVYRSLQSDPTIAGGLNVHSLIMTAAVASMADYIINEATATHEQRKKFEVKDGRKIPDVPIIFADRVLDTPPLIHGQLEGFCRLRMSQASMEGRALVAFSTNAGADDEENQEG